MVAGKTGSLIATSARYGARFGGAAREVEEALTAYGEIVGTAFQLSDDILDIASESAESGKTPGTDLREGVPDAAGADGPRLQDPADARLLELLDADLTDDDLHAEALDLLRKHPAMDEARAYVVARAQEAKALLARRCPRARSAPPSRPSPTSSPSAPLPPAKARRSAAEQVGGGNGSRRERSRLCPNTLPCVGGAGHRDVARGGPAACRWGTGVEVHDATGLA